MVEYLAPGVFVEEVAPRLRPIEGVPTSTAAFLGETERGPIRPTLVTSYADYARWFGGAGVNLFVSGERYLPYAVSGFFANGGRRLYVCRIVAAGARTASRAFGGYRVLARGAGEWGNRVWVAIGAGTATGADGNALGFRLRVAYWDAPPAGFEPFDPFLPANAANVPLPTLAEDFDDLSVDPASPDFYEKRLGTATDPKSVLVELALDAADLPPGALPESGEGVLDNGADDPSPAGSADFAGVPADARTEPQGIAALDDAAFREVALVYAPAPARDADAINLQIVASCERERFRFAVLDCAQNVANPSDLDPRTQLPIDSAYAAFYYPWLIVPNLESGEPKAVPPGGHVVGIYARTDLARGVFKAPANEVVEGALDLEIQIDNRQQDELNPRGVNVIRRFVGRGIRVWGARTLSSDNEWMYVSTRRLFIFLEHSLYGGLQWVVFEPNDEPLWARVRDAVEPFLVNQWRQGAFQGAKPEEAFFVRCDRTTMTQDDIENGRLICLVGVAPLRPAEFVIFRIFQHTAEMRP